MNRREFVGALAGGAIATRSNNDPFVVGFVYNGPKNDLGYNQAHAEGKQSLRDLSFVRALDEANVPETVAVEESMRNMIHRRACRCVVHAGLNWYEYPPRKNRVLLALGEVAR